MSKNKKKFTFVLHPPTTENEARLYLEEDFQDGSINLWAEFYKVSNEILMDFKNGAGRSLVDSRSNEGLKTDSEGRLKIKKERL